ncbi:hypothetical protein UlMin_009994 [Ulmus minor]
MGTLLIDQIKKKASSFLQDKYKSARLAFTDVTEAEVLAEEATNSDPSSPDARTMTKIAEASYGIDDYWRIVDLLHKRFYSVDWKEWRQSYKSLVLLEFLLTHGPEEFAEEFQCDADIIQELGAFQYIDDKGFNWGINMQKKSEEILKLLEGGKTLKEARLKALRITKEIHGFGSSNMASPTSSSTPSSSTSESSRTSSFGSFSTTSSAWNDANIELNKAPQMSPTKEIMEIYSHGGIRGENKYDRLPTSSKSADGLHLWDCPPIEESGSILKDDRGDEDEDRKEVGFVNGIFSKLPVVNAEKVGFRSVSDVGKMVTKKFTRQFSLWY